MRAFIFPGQGSQAIGMGQEMAKALPVAREVFQEVDEALGQNLSRLMWEGDLKDLTLTENAQPALMTVSIAVVRALEKECGIAVGQVCAYVAGHSLGEYSALTAAGALSLADTARLLKTRGQAMQAAVPVGEGAMAALIGLDYEAAAQVAQAAAEDEICTAANDNAPGQVVISGSRAAVERAMVLAREAGAKRALELPVSAPFHCALMEPAAKVMRAALDQITITQPSVSLVANVTAQPVSDPATIRDQLVAQVTGMVRWRESVVNLAALGIDNFVELGAGKVLTGLVKRINRDVKASHIATMQDLENFAQTL